MSHDDSSVFGGGSLLCVAGVGLSKKKPLSWCPL